jgi:hypothetical protein
MWLTGLRNIPHAGQDTTAAIESYHGNMKAILKQSHDKLKGRRVDWLIHQLTGDVINHYDYIHSLGISLTHSFSSSCSKDAVEDSIPANVTRSHIREATTHP